MYHSTFRLFIARSWWSFVPVVSILHHKVSDNCSIHLLVLIGKIIIACRSCYTSSLEYILRSVWCIFDDKDLKKPITKLTSPSLLVNSTSKWPDCCISGRANEFIDIHRHSNSCSICKCTTIFSIATQFCLMFRWIIT